MHKITKRNFLKRIGVLFVGLFIAPKIAPGALKPVEKVPDPMVGNFESYGGIFDRDGSFRKTRRSTVPCGNWRKLHEGADLKSGYKINGRSS